MAIEAIRIWAYCPPIGTDRDHSQAHDADFAAGSWRSSARMPASSRSSPLPLDGSLPHHRLDTEAARPFGGMGEA
jgi:hypothetical protein